MNRFGCPLSVQLESHAQSRQMRVPHYGMHVQRLVKHPGGHYGVCPLGRARERTAVQHITLQRSQLYFTRSVCN